MINTADQEKLAIAPTVILLPCNDVANVVARVFHVYWMYFAQPSQRLDGKPKGYKLTKLALLIVYSKLLHDFNSDSNDTINLLVLFSIILIIHRYAVLNIINARETAIKTFTLKI